MEDTIWKSMKVVILWLSVVLLSQVTETEAGEYCGTHYGGYKWCEYDCCGSYGDEHCCDYNYVGAIIGGIIALVIIGVIIALVICCCVASCPLHRRRTQGTILGWGNGQTVMTTTVQNPHAVVGTVNPAMQPVQYGFPQQQQGAVVMQYPQNAYPQPPAYAPPTYQQAGQYPPAAGAPPPAPSTVDTKY